MHVIAVVSTKGGAGKTTLATSLAVRAAQDSARVALVDLDPQGSLDYWHRRRGNPDVPALFRGTGDPEDDVDAMARDGWDWVFLDCPPALLHGLRATLAVSTFAVIPSRATEIDLLACKAAIQLARDAGVPFRVVLNAVPTTGKSGVDARAFLIGAKVPTAETMIHHRASYIAALSHGKTAAEVNSGRDKAAADEIDALWREIKAAVRKAAKVSA